MGKSWSVVEAKAKLSEVLKHAEHHPQVIENRGAPVAVIVSFDEYTLLRRLAGDLSVTPMQRLLHASEVLRTSGSDELALPLRDDRRMESFGDASE